MKIHRLICATAIIFAGTVASASTPKQQTAETEAAKEESLTSQSDNKLPEASEAIDSLRLTDNDYIYIADMLDVEIAAIKAVVDIEAGRTHQGFFKPGKPIINFDIKMFRRFAGRRGISLAKYRSSHSEVFAGPNARRHGSTQAAQHIRLEKARTINEVTALEGTFWGMFQLGGFNWKKCGCSSIHEFVELMSRSERDQLELFANFITSTGLVKHLKNKNWASFARGYNGPSYAARGYHTRMAKAYARHKSIESKLNDASDGQSKKPQESTLPQPAKPINQNNKK